MYLFLPFCLTLFGLALLYLYRWRHFPLAARFAEAPAGEADMPAGESGHVTVVIPTCNACDKLAANLPEILRQEFDGRLDVIVVDDNSEDDTIDLLHRLESQYANLRHTGLPPTARYVDREKLAITLGIRAARSPWVVLTRPECAPVSSKWIQTLSQAFRPGCDFVLGYANFVDDGSAVARRAIFERLQRHLFYLRAVRRGRAVGGDECNLALRKQTFVEGRGFADTTYITVGAVDLLVDQLAEPGHTVALMSPEAAVSCPLPSREVLAARRTADVEVACHLSRDGRRLLGSHCVAGWGMICTLVGFLASAAATIALWLSLYATTPLPWSAPDVAEALLRPLTDAEGVQAAVAASSIWGILLLVAALVPVMCLRRSTDCLRERRFGLIIWYYGLCQPARELLFAFRHRLHRRLYRRRM